MIGADFSETEARIDRVMAFIRDTITEARVDEPAGRGAGWSVDYDDGSIRGFIMEVMVGVALPLPPPDLGGFRCDGTYRLPPENPAEVIGYCWEVNADHPRLSGKAVLGGGTPVRLGERGPVFTPVPWMRARPWGLTQVWIMRNGQEVRARWKERGEA